MKLIQIRFPTLLALVLSTPSAFAQGGDAAKGKELVTSKNCLQCHAVEASAPAGKAGPSLFGVANKRDKAWLKQIIKDPNQMKSDPIVKELKRKYPVGMPASNLTDAQVTDVIAYLETLGGKASGK